MRMSGYWPFKYLNKNRWPAGLIFGPGLAAAILKNPGDCPGSFEKNKH